MKCPQQTSQLLPGKQTLCQFVFLLFLSVIATGCAVNPVTGHRELHLVPESWEINVGTEQYTPTRQGQGGDYKQDPELTAYVKEVGQSLARVSDRPHLPFDFEIIDSSEPNAWAMPGGKIAINRGLLLELHDEAELAAVLGHEVVHSTARHGAKSVERGLLLGAAVAGLSLAVSESDFQEYQGVIVSAAGLGTNLITFKYSRDQEFEADYYGMQYMARAGYEPRAAIGLQQTFVKLAKSREPNWLEGIFSTHPPSQARVDANIKTAQELNLKSGKIGAEKYQRKIAKLRKQKPAHDARDRGYKALQDGKTKQALALADKAIRMLPGDAKAYALRAAVGMQEGNDRLALADWNRAIRRNPQYFQFYLERGLLQEKMGNGSAAAQDLQKSISLLPTATAHYKLGNILLSRNDRKNALNHFKAASAANTPIGKSAKIAAAKLDFPQNPGQYMHIFPTVNQAGALVLVLKNYSPVELSSANIYVTVADAAGHVQSVRLDLRQALPPKGQRILVTGIKVANQQAADKAKIKIDRIVVR